MKKNKLALALCIAGISTSALMTGCVVAPPYEGTAVVDVVPDFYCWDGYEYVGWVGDRYYYLGPRHVWLASDAVRVQRFNAWTGGHPQWRSQATVNVKFRVDAGGHSHPVRQSPARHDPGHDSEHGHSHGHDDDRGH